MARKTKLQSETARDWDRDPKLEGTIVKKGTQKMPSFANREVLEDREFLLIVTAEGRRERVYKNAALADLFAKAEAKDHVSLESLGKRDTSSGRPFRVFQFELWTE